jgi:hypothetical protein
MEVKFLYVDFSHANKEMASEMTKWLIVKRSLSWYPSVDLSSISVIEKRSNDCVKLMKYFTMCLTVEARGFIWLMKETVLSEEQNGQHLWIRIICMRYHPVQLQYDNCELIIDSHHRWNKIILHEWMNWQQNWRQETVGMSETRNLSILQINSVFFDCWNSIRNRESSITMVQTAEV